MSKPRTPFWDFVDRSQGQDACWPWLGWRNALGYGILQHGPRGQSKKFRATHIALDYATGAWPIQRPGDMVRHRCDNPCCCNPAHLLVGSNADNVADMVARGRQARGAGAHSAKLSDADIRDIRRAHLAGETLRSLAARYGVAHTNIWAIVKRVSWKHLE